MKYPYLGKLHSTPPSLRCRLKRDNSYDFLSNLCCQQLDKIYNKIIQSTCLELYLKIYIFKKCLKNNKSKIYWIHVIISTFLPWNSQKHRYPYRGFRIASSGTPGPKKRFRKKETIKSYLHNIGLRYP